VLTKVRPHRATDIWEDDSGDQPMALRDHAASGTYLLSNGELFHNPEES
jgi:hypothetical protein